MKFLVLALCVAAASAASFPYKAYNPVPAVVNPIVTVPVVTAQAAAAVVPAAKTVYKTVPEGSEAAAAVVRSDSEVTANGYRYVYETANGIAGEASGALKRVGDADVVTSQGSYRYVSPDGTPVAFSYVADENGFQPQGDLLPVGPPIPEAILRSLEYIAANYKPEAAEKKF